MTIEKTSVKLCRAARAGIRYERETVKKNCSRYDVKKRTFRQFASLMSLGFASRRSLLSLNEFAVQTRDKKYRHYFRNCFLSFRFFHVTLVNRYFSPARYLC